MGKSKNKDSNHQLKMGARVHYMRKKCYNTKSNKMRQVRTPGGKLVAHLLKKKAKAPQTPMTTFVTKLSGLKKLRPHDYKKSPKSSRRISRVYGGVLTHSAVKDRIIRTLLSEEVKSVKMILGSKSSEGKSKKKAAKTKGKKKPVARKLPAGQA